MKELLSRRRVELAVGLRAMIWARLYPKYFRAKIIITNYIPGPLHFRTCRSVQFDQAASTLLQFSFTPRLQPGVDTSHAIY